MTAGESREPSQEVVRGSRGRGAGRGPAASRQAGSGGPRPGTLCHVCVPPTPSLAGARAGRIGLRRKPRARSPSSRRASGRGSPFEPGTGAHLNSSGNTRVRVSGIRGGEHMTDLQTTWFLLVGILFAGYSILDGIDCGVGTLLLETGRRDTRSGAALSARSAPRRSGTSSGSSPESPPSSRRFRRFVRRCSRPSRRSSGLFALVLVLRAAALGSGRARKTPDGRSRDVAFGVLSVLAAFLPGLILGNVLRGLPLDAQGATSGARRSPEPLRARRRPRGRRALRVAGRLLAEPRAGSTLGERTQDAALRAWVTVVALHGRHRAPLPLGRPAPLEAPTTTPSRGSPRSSCSCRSSPCRFS